jgi:dTDP-4-amino-4,6-dideoxygalactose transaminase
MSERIPLLLPQLPSADALLPYLQQIDGNRWYTNFGPLVRQLESRISENFMREPAPVQVVTVANGTVGLELALAALGLKRGTKVLLPALTFVATASAALRVGYLPLICDVDPESWLLTPTIARAMLQQQPFDVVMPVATFGVPQPVGEWDNFTAETGIPVVIDAAGAYGNQAIGVTTRVVFSLHATKALGAGEGGLVASRQFSFAEKVRQLSNFGIDFTSGGLVFDPGENGKMSEYHAAIAHAALDAWEKTCATRLDLQQQYQRALVQHCPSVQVQRRPASGIYPIQVVLLPEGVQAKRVQSALLDYLIESRQWYCPTLDIHPAFAGYKAGDLPISHALSVRLLGLPYSIDMTDAQIEHVCMCLHDILGVN